MSPTTGTKHHAAPAVPTAADILADRFRDALSSMRVADLLQQAPYLVVRAAIFIGERRFVLDIDRRHMTVLETLPPLSPWDFAIRGTPDAWAAHWEPMPRPGWHDLFALSKGGEMSFEGNLHPFLCHLQFFKDLLALPREGTVR